MRKEEDRQNSVVLRGLQLTLQIPSTDPTKRAYVNPDNPNAGVRGPVKVRVAKIPSLTGASNCDGDGVACRTLEVVYMPLGMAMSHYDQQIVAVADRTGIPPQFLKSQAMTETSLFSLNFRYEPSTVDFASISGDFGKSISKATKSGCNSINHI